jgi:hypothetical protein
MVLGNTEVARAGDMVQLSTAPMVWIATTKFISLFACIEKELRNITKRKCHARKSQQLLIQKENWILYFNAIEKKYILSATITAQM